MNNGKPCVVIGVGGGIAAYKICTLVSHLSQAGVEVHVLMTKEAQQFVSPLTFQTLSHQRVITDMFSTDFEPNVEHVALAKMADVFVIAPATANLIAKVANGIADDMLTTTFLASRAVKLIVPAMNTGMLENPITRHNIQLLKDYGYHVMESGSGLLACGDSGSGRLPEPEEIQDYVEELLTPKTLAGKKILITAGPTQEAIDPVRYITNHSTGTMGYQLARAARNAAADVILVSGPVHQKTLRAICTVPVITAQDMAQAVLAKAGEMDALIFAAAVADFTPAETAVDKIHKKDSEGMCLELKRTVDILKTVGEHKRPGQTLIGFSMETKDVIASSEAKLTAKNCDYIVANDLREAGAGFGTGTNHVRILSRDGVVDLGLLSKAETARRILDHCLGGK